jgi:hypothetical protein
LISSARPGSCPAIRDHLSIEEEEACQQQSMRERAYRRKKAVTITSKAAAACSLTCCRSLSPRSTGVRAGVHASKVYVKMPIKHRYACCLEFCDFLISFVHHLTFPRVFQGNLSF